MCKSIKYFTYKIHILILSREGHQESIKSLEVYITRKSFASYTTIQNRVSYAKSCKVILNNNFRANFGSLLQVEIRWTFELLYW